MWAQASLTRLTFVISRQSPFAVYFIIPITRVNANVMIEWQTIPIVRLCIFSTRSGVSSTSVAQLNWKFSYFESSLGPTTPVCASKRQYWLAIRKFQIHKCSTFFFFHLFCFTLFLSSSGIFSLNTSRSPNFYHKIFKRINEISVELKFVFIFIFPFSESALHFSHNRSAFHFKYICISPMCNEGD